MAVCLVVEETEASLYMAPWLEVTFTFRCPCEAAHCSAVSFGNNPSISLLPTTTNILNDHRLSFLFTEFPKPDD